MCENLYFATERTCRFRGLLKFLRRAIGPPPQKKKRNLKLQRQKMVTFTNILHLISLEWLSHVLCAGLHNWGSRQVFYTLAWVLRLEHGNRKVTFQYICLFKIHNHSSFLLFCRCKTVGNCSDVLGGNGCLQERFSHVCLYS